MIKMVQMIILTVSIVLLLHLEWKRNIAKERVTFEGFYSSKEDSRAMTHSNKKKYAKKLFENSYPQFVSSPVFFRH